MATIGSGTSAYNSLQTWQAKQKSYTSTYLNNSAVLADDIGSLTLTHSQNMATFAGQQALARVQLAKAAQNAAPVSTADPFASSNAAKKVEQIINGTAAFVSTASSTTDAAKTVGQIISGTSGLITTSSSGDINKTINQIISGNDKIASSNQSADMMTLTKIMYGIDKLPMPPTTDVAT